MKVAEVTQRQKANANEIIEDIAEILNDYNHPKFDVVFERIMKEYNDKQSYK
jgi:predicted choloylglycine hydrolase